MPAAKGSYLARASAPYPKPLRARPCSASVEPNGISWTVMVVVGDKHWQHVGLCGCATGLMASGNIRVFVGWHGPLDLRREQSSNILETTQVVQLPNSEPPSRDTGHKAMPGVIICACVVSFVVQSRRDTPKITTCGTYAAVKQCSYSLCSVDHCCSCTPQPVTCSFQNSHVADRLAPQPRQYRLC